MRLFNREVFRGTAEANTGQYSSSELNGLLGSADRYAIQVIASRATAADKVRIALEHSNDNEHWSTGTLYNTDALAAGQVNTAMLGDPLLDTGIATRGAFVRFRISTDSDEVDVIVTVTGRSV